MLSVESGGRRAILIALMGAVGSSVMLYTNNRHSEDARFKRIVDVHDDGMVEFDDHTCIVLESISSVIVCRGILYVSYSFIMK